LRSPKRSIGTSLIDTLGHLLAVNVDAEWRPDDLFFALMRDREAAGVMLTGVIGATAARSYTDEYVREK
jgi:ParB family transcriptional regulator, chromosome partitioning protein